MCASYQFIEETTEERPEKGLVNDAGDQLEWLEALYSIPWEMWEIKKDGFNTDNCRSLLKLCIIKQWLLNKMGDSWEMPEEWLVKNRGLTDEWPGKSWRAIEEWLANDWGLTSEQLGDDWWTIDSWQVKYQGWLTSEWLENGWRMSEE